MISWASRYSGIDVSLRSTTLSSLPDFKRLQLLTRDPLPRPSDDPELLPLAALRRSLRILLRLLLLGWLICWRSHLQPGVVRRVPRAKHLPLRRHRVTVAQPAP